MQEGPFWVRPVRGELVEGRVEQNAPQVERMVGHLRRREGDCSSPWSEARWERVALDDEFDVLDYERADGSLRSFIKRD